MLTQKQEKLIRSLQKKKYRIIHNKCLVEGEKFIKVAEMAGLLDYTFSNEDTDIFDELTTTKTPQNIAAIADIPEWSLDDINTKKTIIVLDGVQEPGNVGTILRLALGFDASVILIESADPTNTKAIRSSAGSVFLAPWKIVSRTEINNVLNNFDRPIYRLEKRDGAIPIQDVERDPSIVIIGSEGNGIHMSINAQSIFIPHSEKLESLSVSHAVAILLEKRY